MADPMHEDDIREIHRLLHGERPMTQRDREDCERALLHLAALEATTRPVAPVDPETSK